jgi:hypothetical protein
VKLRIGSLFVFLVLIGFGPIAEACEICVPAGYNGWDMCSSGWRTGDQSCYGGFGVPCRMSGISCYDPGGRRREPEQNYSIDCPTCIEAEPDQGFVLRTDAGYSEPSAERAELD